jgi:hypothetical protein
MLGLVVTHSTYGRQKKTTLARLQPRVHTAHTSPSGRASARPSPCNASNHRVAAASVRCRTQRSLSRFLQRPRSDVPLKLLVARCAVVRNFVDDRLRAPVNGHESGWQTAIRARNVFVHGALSGFAIPKSAASARLLPVVCVCCLVEQAKTAGTASGRLGRREFYQNTALRRRLCGAERSVSARCC